MILRPEKTISPLTAIITLRQTQILVRLPERDDRFVALAKRLGYAWEWEAATWQRQINPRLHGAILDRVIELAHAILLAGFPVEVGDLPIDRVVAGEYAAEYKRWVKARLAGAYTGWFALQWARADNFYDRARRLHGSAYDPPSVVVPPDTFLEVLDFADAHGFQLSDEAQRVVAAARARYEAAVLVVPQRRHPAKKIVNADGIDPELRDDMDDDN